MARYCILTIVSLFQSTLYFVFFVSELYMHFGLCSAHILCLRLLNASPQLIEVYLVLKLIKLYVAVR